MGTAGRVLRLLMLALVCRGGSSWTFDNVDTLASAILSSANYNPKLRPFSHDLDATEVDMGLWLASIVNVDDVSQEIQFSGYIYMDWWDPKLEWTPANYNGTLYFAYPQENLWHPDMTIVNSVKTLGELGFDKNAMYIQSDGTVQWTVSGVFSTSCDIDVTFYPFDTQSCSVIFSTLVSYNHEVSLDADPTFAVDLSMYSESGSWALLGVDTEAAVDSSGRSREAFTIKLKRLRTYYIISIIFPILFLGFTVTLVFLLPNESGEKMGLSMVVLLSYAVYLTLLSDMMPKTSLHVSIMAIYLNLMLAQCATGVMVSVWLINLYFRDDEEEKPPKYTIKSAIRMQRIMRWRKKETVVSEMPAKDKDKTGLEKSGLPSGLQNGAPPSATVFRKDLKDLGTEHSRPCTGKATPPIAFARNVFSRQATRVEAGKGTLDDMKWGEVAKTFDRFFFIIFSVSLVLVTIIFLLVLLIGAEFY